MLEQLSWLIVAVPLLASVAIICGGYKNKILSSALSIGAVSISLIYSIVLFALFLGQAEGYTYEKSFNWIKIGSFHLDVGIFIDPLAILMLCIVSSVSLLVQIYSHGYMNEDKGYSKFFAYLSLFTASMLGLVLSSNLFETYIFWELVGLCSYLLIGFWQYKKEAADAAFKAFIVNRVGDAGFLAGILLFGFITIGLWPSDGFLNFSALNSVLQKLSLSETTLPVSLTVICLFLLLGPMAKSAQFPLHTWLPDAMEGPTPISALIHAATMVAAGVFLLARLFPLYQAAEGALTVIAFIGLFTSIFAALIALTQNDIKRALAYSTVSQLGLMFAAIGFGSWIQAIFHLFTHAYFKALLFLGSGSVIHSCHHEQDMNKLGGLARYLPITNVTFLLGTLAISAVPPLAGFWSKEQIIHSASSNNLAFITLSIGAFLTAFYSFRVYFKTFQGSESYHGKPYEDSFSITLPLIILAFPTIFAGLLGSGIIELGGNPFANFLGTVKAHSVNLGEFLKELFTTKAIVPLLCSFIGVGLSYAVYGKGLIRINEFAKGNLNPLYQLSYNKFFIDEVYDKLIQWVYIPATRLVQLLLDRILANGLVNSGSTLGVKIFSWLLSKPGNGQIQAFIFAAILGFILIFLLIIGNVMAFEFQLSQMTMSLPTKAQ